MHGGWTIHDGCWCCPTATCWWLKPNAPAKPDDRQGIRGWIMCLVMARAGATTPNANRITAAGVEMTDLPEGTDHNPLDVGSRAAIHGWWLLTHLQPRTAGKASPCP